jgi:pimeloyl-ACP methyl ester carboxylesterase
VFVHGLGSGKDSPRNVIVAERLLHHGIATLLFDLSGHGESSSDPAGAEGAFVRDLEAVTQWALARPELDPARMGLSGSSLGAIVALEATRRRVVRPAALVLRAPPIEGDELAGVEAPVLIIVGTRDLLLEPVRRVAGGRTNVTLETIEGAGHLFEEPGTLEEAVQKTASWFEEKLKPLGG